MTKAPNPPTGTRTGRFRRVIRLAWRERVGIPLLAVLPVLSFTGLLGPSYSLSRSDTIAATPSAVTLEVEHPGRIRHRASGHLLIAVQNNGTQPLRDLFLGLDEAYITRFAQVRIAPAPSQGDTRYLKVELPPLQAGERARVYVGFEADAWGHHRGRLQVVRSGQPPLAQLEFGTTVLP